MASVNLVILVGYLGKDPESRFLPDGTAVANASVATTETWKDKTGNRQEKTTWSRLVFWGRLAEIAGEYLHKGSLAYFEGSIQNRKYQDKAGNDQYITEIKVSRLTLLDKKPEGTQQRPAQRTQQSNPATTDKRQAEEPTGSSFDEMDDSIPF